jgi:hypothetical protein
MSIDAARERPDTLQDRLAVPWLTVLPFAVVMAYADGFWMTSTRGAVGAIERTGQPFTSWLRESTLSLPLFVFAVVAALTLALRLFGPVLRTPRAVALTALLIVAAGTVVGIVEITASAAYDYFLQSRQLGLMNSMHSSCVGGCLDQQVQATLSVQIRAVLLITGFIVVTNLVLIAWVVALRGGRIKVVSRRRPRDGSLEADHPTRSRVEDLGLLLVAGLLASAHVHAAVLLERLATSPATSGLFLLLIAGEVAVVRLLLTRPGPAQRGVLLAAAAISSGSLLLLLYSRIAGLPFGSSADLPLVVGPTEIVACALEVLTLLAAVALLAAKGWLRLRAPVSAQVRALTVVALIAITAIGLAGTAPTWFDAPGSDGDSVMVMPAAGP